MAIVRNPTGSRRELPQPPHRRPSRVISSWHRSLLRFVQVRLSRDSLTSRNFCAAYSGVISRCGDPSSSKPTINFRILADLRRGKKKCAWKCHSSCLVSSVGCWWNPIEYGQDTWNKPSYRPVTRFKISVSANRPWSSRAPRLPTCCLETTKISYGQTAQKGTTARKYSLLQTKRSPEASSKPM